MFFGGLGVASDWTDKAAGAGAIGRFFLIL